MVVSSEPNGGTRGVGFVLGAARVRRCSWRNVRRKKEAKRQCLESRINLTDDSPGILLQASLSAAQDRRTCPDCGPSVTSGLRKYGVWSHDLWRASILPGHGYAIELDADIAKDTACIWYDTEPGKRYCYRPCSHPRSLLLSNATRAQGRYRAIPREERSRFQAGSMAQKKIVVFQQRGEIKRHNSYINDRFEREIFFSCGIYSSILCKSIDCPRKLRHWFSCDSTISRMYMPLLYSLMHL